MGGSEPGKIHDEFGLVNGFVPLLMTDTSGLSVLVVKHASHTLLISPDIFIGTYHTNGSETSNKEPPGLLKWNTLNET